MNWTDVKWTLVNLWGQRTSNVKMFPQHFNQRDKHLLSPLELQKVEIILGSLWEGIEVCKIDLSMTWHICYDEGECEPIFWRSTMLLGIILLDAATTTLLNNKLFYELGTSINKLRWQNLKDFWPPSLTSFLAKLLCRWHLAYPSPCLST